MPGSLRGLALGWCGSNSPKRAPAATVNFVALDRTRATKVSNTYDYAPEERHLGGSMADIRLYHWEPNANSGKPMLALGEKGVKWESHYIDMLEFDQHKPEYLAINPQGTIPAMVHDGRVLTESTAIMEYVDEAFDGPPLMPADPRTRWRIRWWMKFMDQWLGPSFSMIGWSTFIGPMVRERPQEELEAAIERIPLPERRRAWRKAMYGEFAEEELAESRRRVALGVDLLEKELGKREYVASSQYSLGDINVFNSTYSLPLGQPELCNRERTPNIMRWLRTVYLRPAVQETWKIGSGRIVDRFHAMMEEWGE
ncbi:MAG TPA: glutathione S-transferase family protein [Alteraurantiacibacter sp.]